MLNDVVAAEVLGVSPATMRSWRCRGIGPKYVKDGPGVRAAVRYHRHDFEELIDRRNEEAAESLRHTGQISEATDVA
jgi:hypothetical protein